MSTNSADAGLRWAQCRSLGHSWVHRGRLTDDDEPGFRAPYGTEAGAVAFRSVCAFCGAERVKWMTRSGASYPGRYRYPEDYARHGDARLSNQEWRHEWVVSVLGAPPARKRRAS